MDPWTLAALVAAAIGIGILTSNAAAQANAAIPRVTSFAVVTVPTPGLNGQWDLWVTGLNGLTGRNMMQIIPGGSATLATGQWYMRMIYIPAAIVQAQPTNVDFTYTFTPVGQVATFTIIVPAAILQAYAATPKSSMMARIENSYILSREAGANITMEIFPTNSSNVVMQAIDDASYLVFGKYPDGTVPNPPHLGTLSGGTFDGTPGWLTSNASLITATVQEIIAAFAVATNPDDQKSLNDLKGKIEAFALKAGMQLASVLGGDIANAFKSTGGDAPSDANTDMSNDFSSQATGDSATDNPATDTSTDHPPSDTSTDASSDTSTDS